jgi:hypothetical protein
MTDKRREAARKLADTIVYGKESENETCQKLFLDFLALAGLDEPEREEMEQRDLAEVFRHREPDPIGMLRKTDAPPNPAPPKAEVRRWFVQSASLFVKMPCSYGEAHAHREVPSTEFEVVLASDYDALAARVKELNGELVSVKASSWFQVAEDHSKRIAKMLKEAAELRDERDNLLREVHNHEQIETELRHCADAAEAKLAAFIKQPPPTMSWNGELVPIHSDGMRKVIDAHTAGVKERDELRATVERVKAVLSKWCSRGGAGNWPRSEIDAALRGGE